MRKRFLSALLVFSMAAAALAGCGSEDKDKGSSDSTNKGASSENNSSGTVSDGGKVLNIYCWNEEFKSRVTDYFPGYKKKDATSGTIGDVTVKWNITPNENNAYQDNLDAALQKQESASADEKVDVFLVEADYALKYVNSKFAAPLTDLGVNDSDLSEQYQYTKDVVTDSNGVLKGTSWQAAPGVLFYNREAAKEVLGSDDPAKVQEYVKDWETFGETAETMKKAGYKIMSTANDSYRVYSNNVSSKWVEDGKINIDDNIMKWVDDSKKLVDAKYTGAYDMWSDDWKKGFYPEGKVFCYFGPAWLVNFSMAADTEGSIGNKGGWGATEGPQGFYWGGTWICAAAGSDNSGLIKDIMLQLTANADIMKAISKGTDDFVNNQPVMEEMAESKYSSKILGGQNPLGIYCNGVKDLSLSNVTGYDLGCTEEFQHAMKNYFEGNATKEEALDQFYKAVVEKYPDLTY